jgi:hypothetical protein
VTWRVESISVSVLALVLTISVLILVLAVMIWTSHFKFLRLLHVVLFLKCAIEIGTRNVHRAKLNVLQSSQGKDAHGGVANCGSKGRLLEIKARVLRIALVAVQGAISIVLYLQEPSMNGPNASQGAI